MRDVTACIVYLRMYLCVSTHTPHAGRDELRLQVSFDDPVSTHTPHAGRDLKLFRNLPTLCVSTHTPHAGRDLGLKKQIRSITRFYSHAPCGT